MSSLPEYFSWTSLIYSLSLSCFYRVQHFGTFNFVVPCSLKHPTSSTCGVCHYSCYLNSEDKEVISVCQVSGQFKQWKKVHLFSKCFISLGDTLYLDVTINVYHFADLTQFIQSKLNQEIRSLNNTNVPLNEE